MCLVLHSNACCQTKFYDTFHAYKTSEVGEASILDPRQKMSPRPKEEGGDGAEREEESPRTATEDKMEMGLNKKQKAPVLLQRLRKRKRRG